MTSESKSTAGLPSQGEARAIVERARRLRAETLAGLGRAVLRRLGHGKSGVRPVGLAGALPHAHA